MKIALYHCMNSQVAGIELEVKNGSTIDDILPLFPKVLGLTWDALHHQGYSLSVFGKKQAMSYQFAEGDRLELCGPLIASPMDARRRRAKREHRGGKM